MFALGLLSWMYSGRPRARSSSSQQKFANKPDIAEANIDRVQGRLQLRRDHRGLRGLLRGQAGAAAAGHLPQHHRQPGAGLRPGRRRAARRDCRCSSAPTRSPRPATSCTSWPSTSASACARSRPRTRSPASARRSARRSAARSAVTTSSGPGHRAQGRDDRPGRVAGAAAGHLRHPARRPVDRAADQDRAVRPAAGDVRPQRRGAGADRAPRSRRRTASTPRSRRRGSRSTYRTPVFLLSDGYLANGSEPWRVPTVADAARPAGRVRHRAQRHRTSDVPALPARPGDAGPAVGGSRHGRARAPHRRHREGRQDRQHLLRPGQPRLHGPHPAGQGRRHRARRSRRWRSTTRPATRKVLVLGWGSTYGPIGAACRRVRAGGAAGRAGPPAPPQPVPGRPRRGPAPLRAGRHPGDEPRPAGDADPRRKYLVDAISVHPGPRAAVQGRRAGRDASRT